MTGADRMRQTRPAQYHHVWSGDSRDHRAGADLRAVRTAHAPRPSLAEVEPDPPLVIHAHGSADPLDPSHDVGSAFAQGHVVGHPDYPGRRLMGGLQDEAVAQVPAGGPGRPVWPQQPVTVVSGAQQRGETGGRVETWQGSQSMEPSRPTSAAVSMSPSTA